MRAILTWHSIDGSGSPISVDPPAFRRQVEWLASGSVRVVPMSELLLLPDTTDAVALTFDDGFANFADEALPLLADHAMKATIFVVSDRVGLDNAWPGSNDRVPILPLMDWATLGRIAEQGLEIAAHTRSHPHLRALDDRRLEDELAGCAEAIATKLGRRPVGVAYPYGEADTRVMLAAARHHSWACSTFFRTLSGSDDRFALPRLDAWYFRDPQRLAAWGTSRFRAWVWARRKARAVRAAIRRTLA